MMDLTRSHTMTPFLKRQGNKPFENIMGKGETASASNYSFSHNVFYSIKDRNYHSYIEFVVCKCFQFGLTQNFVMWEWIKLEEEWSFDIQIIYKTSGVHQPVSRKVSCVFSARFANLKVMQLDGWVQHYPKCLYKPYGLVNQKLCHI